MKVSKTVKTWEKTRLKNLVRHKTGTYYVRAFANCKEVWKSLKTKHFSVAEARLADFLKDHRQHRNLASDSDLNMVFASALSMHREKIADDVSIKDTTRHYWSQIFTALLKSWPELDQKQIRKITAHDCQTWSRQFAKVASPTRFNNTIAALRHVFDVAIEANIIYANPTAKLVRLPIRAKQLNLPSQSQFAELIKSVESAGAWCSKDCADSIQGLAFTGMRKGEASLLTWQDVDFNAEEIVVRGDPETGTKNWEIRRVPLIEDARKLFLKMRETRNDGAPNACIFRVGEAQKAIDSAITKLGISRFTHHDLRHLFATTCIESGVDIPTVSRWLGHKDGGALAMKTYGHLRREHSISQAKKVSFAAITELAA